MASPNDWTIERSLTGEVRISDTPAKLRREIRSSWNQSQGGPSRSPKVVTAEPARIPLRRHQKQARPAFTNDINGWNVRDEK
jgi:hypothetical protein